MNGSLRQAFMINYRQYQFVILADLPVVSTLRSFYYLLVGYNNAIQAVLWGHVQGITQPIIVMF